MKITANFKIKEKIKIRFIQKQALSSIEAQIVNIVNSKWDHHHWK